MKKILTSIIALFMMLSVSAQSEVKLTINHLLGTSAFAFNQTATNDLNQPFQLQRLEYYISGISITHDTGKIESATNIHILVDGSKNDTFTLGTFDITNIEAITFSIGVDPFVNNGDPATWPSGHPLAPRVPTMHWGWNAGYRFVALEGNSGNAFNQTMQIHALGNENFFKQNINLSSDEVNGAKLITLNANYANALKGINIAQGLFEHSTEGPAITCLRNFQNDVFTSKTGESNTLTVKSATVPDAYAVYPNPSNGVLNIKMNDTRFENGNLTIVNQVGARVFESEQIDATQVIKLPTAGIYFITIEKNGLMSTQKVLVQ